MGDRELADKIVGLGVADEKHPPHLYRLGNKYQFGYFGWVPAHRFVRDWKVAGALMEEVDITKLDWDLIGIRAVVINSLPRAITEACVEALS